MIINQSSGGGSSSSNNSQVGDMLYTERKPDMSKWLECNGAQVSTSEYKELFNVLGKKYGSQGDVSTSFCSYSSPSYNTRYVKFNDGSMVVEYYDNNQIRTYRTVFDASGKKVTTYQITSTTQGYGDPSAYTNTMVALPNGDVIAVRSQSGKLMKISNIKSTSATYTDISGLSFGKNSNSCFSYTCSAQIVCDEKTMTYYILTPVRNPYTDEDDSYWWDAYYDLYSTKDFSTFTKLVSSFYDNNDPKRLVAVNGNIFLLPLYDRNSGGGRVYRLENNTFIQNTSMRYLQNLVYVNGYYYGTHNYRWNDNTVTGIYVAGDDLSFSKLYPGTSWGSFYGMSSSSPGYFSANLSVVDGDLVVSSTHGSGGSITCLGVFKVNSDGTLSLTNTLRTVTDDARTIGWMAGGSNYICYKYNETLYYSTIYPTHFKLPAFHNAYGATSSSYHGTTATSPTPYIRAKD